MYFIDEQEKKVFENFDAITSYIETEIQPYIPMGEKVSVGFRSFDGNEKCKLNVENYNIDGHIGNIYCNFNMVKELNYASWALEFVLNWKDIKNRLNGNLDYLLKEYAHIAYAIENFEV